MSNPWGSSTATASSSPTAKKDPHGFSSVKSSDPYSFGVPRGFSDQKISSFVGELLLVEPTDYIESMLTSASKEPTDAWRVNVTPLTGEFAGQTLPNMLVFQVALKNELRTTYSGPNPLLLARLTRGEAKHGPDSGAYLFAEPSPEDVRLAEKWQAAQRAS